MILNRSRGARYLTKEALIGALAGGVGKALELGGKGVMGAGKWLAKAPMENSLKAIGVGGGAMMAGGGINKALSESGELGAAGFARRMGH